MATMVHPASDPMCDGCQRPEGMTDEDVWRGVLGCRLSCRVPYSSLGARGWRDPSGRLHTWHVHDWRQKEPCRWCDGRGGFEALDMACRECEGRGWRMVAAWDVPCWVGEPSEALAWQPRHAPCVEIKT